MDNGDEMDWDCEIEDWQGWKIIGLKGEITTRCIIEVRNRLGEVELNDSSRGAAFDLSKLEFVDSSFIQLLGNFRRKVIEKGLQFKILSPSDDVREIFETLSLEELTGEFLEREKFEKTY